MAFALKSCPVLRKLNLSRNQPGGRPEALVSLVKEHASLTSLSIVEEDDKHLSSKAKTLLVLAAEPEP